MKIAILGCGYAGLSLALTLKHHEVHIFEQSKELLPVGAGVLLQPLGFQVLKELGLEDHPYKLGNKISVLSGQNEKGIQILDLKYRQPHSGMGIHRGFLFEHLLMHLDRHSIHIHLNEQVTQLEVNGSKSNFISNGQVYNDFDIVVVANGANSKFRNILPGFVYEKEYPWGAFWGIFENTSFPNDVLYQKYQSTKKLLGLLPCGINPHTNKSIINFFWSARKNQIQDIQSKGIEAFKAEIREFDSNITSLLDQIQSFDNLIYTTYHDVYCQQWHHGNVVFLGDAIHGMSPQLGIGLNIALLDGYILGNLLNRDHFKIQDLSLLKRIRKHQNFYYHFTSQIMTRFFQSDYPILGSFRDFIFPNLPKVNFIDKLMSDSLCGFKSGFFTKASAEEQIKSIHDQINKLSKN